MHKGFLKTASILGALSVLLGAFTAHTLKQHISPVAINIFETAVRYQVYHVFALFITAILFKDFNNNLIRLAGIFFIMGIILFSGSLYIMTFLQGSTTMPAGKWIGVITPFGGLSFIAGWLCLFAGIVKNK